MSGRPRRKKRSPVWEYFLLDESNASVECSICRKKMHYSQGSTTNMIYHLERKHEISTSEDSLSRGLSGAARSAHRRDYQPGKGSLITKQIVNMCVSDLRPLSLVEGVGFRSLMKLVEPEYEVPLRSSFAVTLDHQYQITKTIVTYELQRADHIALTTDSWTTDGETAVTVTAHFITDDWQVRQVVLLTQAVSPGPRSDSGGLSLALRRCREAFEISSDRITGLVYDRSEFLGACTSLRWAHARCFGNALELCLTKGFEIDAIDRLVQGARKLAENLNAVPAAKMELSLPDPCLTDSWNDTFDLISRLVDQRGAIHSVLSPASSNINLKQDAWDRLQELNAAVEPLRCAIQVLCGQKHVPVSLVVPVIAGLLKKHLKEVEGDSAAIKSFKHLVKGDIARRYDTGSAEDNLSVLACALDPRFKNLRFLDEDSAQNVRRALIGKMQKNREAHPAYEAPRGFQDDYPTRAPPKSARCNESVISFLLGDFDESEQEDCDNSLATLKEINAFHESPSLHNDGDPLKWWKTNSAYFPHLSRLAKKYLCVPATAVPGERIFSASRNTFSQKRRALDNDTVNQLLFLNSNYSPKPLTIESISAAPPSTSYSTAGPTSPLSLSIKEVISVDDVTYDIVQVKNEPDEVSSVTMQIEEN